MTPFTYHRATTADEALRQAGGGVRYLGGGTNLIDLMRENIERPSTLIDVTGLDTGIVEQSDGGMLIGAAARNTAVAEHRAIREQYPLLSPRDRRRSQRADSQYGDRRWQHPAAHPVPLFLRPEWHAM